jgi:septum formation inhibitor-activating ATPase MinD
MMSVTLKAPENKPQQRGLMYKVQLAKRVQVFSLPSVSKTLMITCLKVISDVHTVIKAYKGTESGRVWAGSTSW